MKVLSTTRDGQRADATTMPGWRRGVVIVYALFTIAMGLVLVVSSGLSAVGLAQGVFWLALAIALILNNPKGPTLVWVMVVLSGLGTLMRGLIPIEIAVMALNAWFAVWYARLMKPATLKAGGASALASGE
jgi:hypothetical protein